IFKNLVTSEAAAMKLIFCFSSSNPTSWIGVIQVTSDVTTRERTVLSTYDHITM
ncbi:hypothetical protein L9F63_018022, partial [Diploptera punctata]